MVWAVTGVAFVATLLVVLAAAYAVYGGKLAVPERLSRLWHAPVGPAPQRDEKKPVKRALSEVGKMVPSSPQKLSRTQKLLARAGYRRPEAASIFIGAQVFLAASFLVAVITTGIYRHSPMLLLPFSALIGYFGPELWLTQRILRRQHRIRLSLPDALDLLVICVEAGLGLDYALLRVGQELKIAHPELCQELELVNAEIRVGKSRIEALRGLATRTGVDDVKALVAMLIQTDRFGTSIAQSLRVHSDDLRTKRRQRAEEAAAKTTVKMVPPLVFFIFPALFVVILGPAVISIARNFLPVLSR